jgi:Tol biopolymer transport system component
LEELGDPASYDELGLAPDGRVVVERSTVTTNNVDLWVLDPTRGTTSRLTFDPQVDVDPVWTPDGRHVIYSAQDETGGWELRRRAASGVGEAQTLAHFDAFAMADDITSDGVTLIVNAFRGETTVDILLLDLAADADPRPFIATPFAEFDAQLSPDDRWLAYGSDESGRDEIYVRSFPGGESKWQVSIEGGDQPTWRADGKELFYVSDDRRLMSVPVDTREGLVIGTPEELFPLTWARAGGNEYEPSPDGQRFLFLRDIVETDPSPFTVVMNWNAELPK